MVATVAGKVSTCGEAGLCGSQPRNDGSNFIRLAKSFEGNGCDELFQLIFTYREAPRDADTVSQQLMLRAGMIQKVAAGIYDYLPLALRSIRKFERIVREVLERDGCQ